MWILLSLVMTLGLFSILAFSHLSEQTENVRESSLHYMEKQASLQLQTFTSAAWIYSKTQKLTAGQTISVQELINSGYLPSSFESTNNFGQTLTALVGNNTLAAFYANQPTYLYGLTLNNSVVNASVAMSIAKILSSMQANSAEYIAGVTYNGGGNGTSYNMVLLPYAVSGLVMGTDDPQISTSFPSAVDLVNIMPSTH